MSKLIYGCDPDSKASGIAVYLRDRLVELECMTLVEIYKHFEIETRHSEYDEVELHIENLNAISSSAFHIKKTDSAAVKQKKSEGVGRCKQVQIEIERMAEHFGIKVIHHKVSKTWKSQVSKKQFEMITGWKKRSNEDSRSAAWFGYLGATAKQ